MQMDVQDYQFYSQELKQNSKHAFYAVLLNI